MVLPGVGKPEALCGADRIRATIANHAFDQADQQPLGSVSISGGVASWPIDGRDSTSVIECADRALYKAKQEGRNRVLAYHPSELGSLPDVDGSIETESTEDGGRKPEVKV